jgi:hypothetical protein
MKKVLSMSIISIGLCLSANAGDYTMTPNGNYVSGSTYTMTPDGKYVGGSTYNMAPDGSYHLVSLCNNLHLHLNINLLR